MARKYWEYSFEPGRDGQRPCARAEWCASSVTVTEAGASWQEPALGPRNFCLRDEALIGRCLSELPAQYVHLAAGRAVLRRHGAAVRVPFGPRLPLRLDAEALQALMAEILVSWHEQVAAVARLAFPQGRRRRGRAVADAEAVLSAHLSVLLGLEPRPVCRAAGLRDVAALPDDTWGVVHPVFAELDLDLGGRDAGLEILHLRFLARALLGETRDRPEELVGVPCRADGCGHRCVYRAELPSREGEPAWWSECARCGDRMTEPEYREWTALCAAYERNRRRIPAVLENLPGVA